MRQSKSTYILLILILSLVSCKITRRVPEGKLWIKKNKVEMEGKGLDEEQFEEIIKQKANYKSLGMRLRLRRYNIFDSTSVAKSRIKKNEKVHAENRERRAKQNRINQRRIERARERGETYYRKKEIKLIDTLNPKPTFKERIKYRYGEPPVVLNSSAFNRTRRPPGSSFLPNTTLFGSVTVFTSFVITEGYLEPLKT